MENVNFGSISVAESLPALIIKPRTTAGAPTIYTEGMSGTTAAALDWGPIIDFLVDLGIKTLGGDGGGGGGGGKGCTTIKITNADGSSTEIKQCPPPKPA